MLQCRLHRRSNRLLAGKRFCNQEVDANLSRENSGGLYTANLVESMAQIDKAEFTVSQRSVNKGPEGSHPRCRGADTWFSDHEITRSRAITRLLTLP